MNNMKSKVEQDPNMPNGVERTTSSFKIHFQDNMNIKKNEKGQLKGVDVTLLQVDLSDDDIAENRGDTLPIAAYEMIHVDEVVDILERFSQSSKDAQATMLTTLRSTLGHTQNANGDVDYDDDAADFSAAQRIMFGEGYKRSHTVEVLQLIFHGEDRPKEVGKEKVRVT